MKLIEIEQISMEDLKNFTAYENNFMEFNKATLVVIGRPFADLADEDGYCYDPYICKVKGE